MILKYTLATSSYFLYIYTRHKRLLGYKLVKYTRLLAFICLITTTNKIFAQQDLSREELKKKRAYYIERLKKAKALIESSDSDKKISITQLKTVNYQVTKTIELAQNLQSDNKALAKYISEAEETIEQHKGEIDGLKKDYAQMIYTYSKTRHHHQMLSYIFSSNGINQFISRLNFLRQYQAKRKSQTQYINRKVAELKIHRQQLKERLREQEEILAAIQQITASLQGLKDKKTALRNELKKRIKKSDIAIEKRKIDARSQQAFVAANRASKKAVASLLSESFSAAQKKLAWPVDDGIIISKFGKHPHPVIEGVEVDNLGIDIRTDKRNNVRSVFDGKVLIVTKIPGMNYMVIIQHGLYFTAYARLGKVHVKTGQKIKSGTKLGSIAVGEDGLSVLQFQIWKNKQRLDPENWLLANAAN